MESEYFSQQVINLLQRHTLAFVVIWLKQIDPQHVVSSGTLLNQRRKFRHGGVQAKRTLAISVRNANHDVFNSLQAFIQESRHAPDE
jgi:hypothetical protein